MMAGDWIPLRTSLAGDPAIIQICDRSDLDAFGVVGRLHAVWSWASHNLTDGHAPVTLSYVDTLSHYPGFGKLLAEVGWLIDHGDAIEFPRWDEWNSRSAKKRLQAARRKAKSRESVTDVTQRSRSRRDKSVTTEQNRTDIPPTPPAGAGGGDSVDEIGTSDPAVSARMDALRSAGLTSPQAVNRIVANPEITMEIILAVCGEVTRTGGGPGAIVSALENQEARDAILAAAKRRFDPEQHRQAVDRRTAVRASEKATHEKRLAAEQEALRSVWKAVASQDKDLVLAAAELFCNRQPSAPVAPWKPIDPGSDPATWPVQNRLALQHIIEERQATIS